MESSQEEEKHKRNPERGRNGWTELEISASLKAAALDGGAMEKGGEYVQFVSFKLLFKMVIIQRCFTIQYCSVKG